MRNLRNVNYNDNYDESEDDLTKEKSTLFQEFEQRVDPLAMLLSTQPNQFQTLQQHQVMQNQQQMNMRQLHQQNQMMQQIPMQLPQQQQIPQSQQFLGFDIPKLFQSVPIQKHQELNLLMQNITSGIIPANEFVSRLQVLMSNTAQKVIPIMPNPAPTNFQIKIEKDQQQKRPVESNPVAVPPPAKRVKQNSRPVSKAPMPKLATPNPDSAASTPQALNPPSATVKEVDLDLEGMMDVTNYAGVNLKDEESALNEMGTGVGIREKFKHMPFLDTELVEERLFELGAMYGIEDIDETLANFISCAAELYATRLLEQMCKIADHRMATDYTTLASIPSLKSNSEWILDVETVDDVRQTLLDMEAVERQEENQLLATVGPRPNPEDELLEDSNLPSTQQSSSKKRSSAKKDLPEAVKNKLANQAVQMAIGGTQKSWMNAGGTSFGSRPGALPAQKQTPVALGPGVLSNIPVGARAGPKRISIKDALIVVENRKELRTSELLYKWYANIK